MLPFTIHCILPGGNTSAVAPPKKQATIAPNPLAIIEDGQLNLNLARLAKQTAVTSPTPISVSPAPGGHQRPPTIIAQVSPTNADIAEKKQYFKIDFMLPSLLLAERSLLPSL